MGWGQSSLGGAALPERLVDGPPSLSGLDGLQVLGFPEEPLLHSKLQLLVEDLRGRAGGRTSDRSRRARALPFAVLRAGGRPGRMVWACVPLPLVVPLSEQPSVFSLREVFEARPRGDDTITQLEPASWGTIKSRLQQAR